MHRMLYVPVLTVFLLLVACASNVDDTADVAGGHADHSAAVDNPQATWVEGSNRFGADLYAQLVADNEGKNLCYSPISAYLAFGMLYPGAVGDAREEMAKVLRLGMPESQVNETAKAMLRRYADADTSRGVIELANSAWYQKDYPVEDSYVTTVRENYDAMFAPCDFIRNFENERVRINKWAEEKTHGRIPEPLPPNSLNSDSRLVLVNATYLKQYWRSMFEGGSTTDRPFYLDGGDKVQAPTMHATRRTLYREGREFQSIELPYRDERFSMLFVLPKKGHGVDALGKTFMADGLAPFLPKRDAYQNIDIALPKFEFKNDYELNEPLMRLGMERIFFPGGAFRGICKSDDQLCVDIVLQSTFIKVDEEGTEAAAVTVIGMKAMSAAPEPAKLFRADHPFMFFLRDNDTGAVLFMGRVMDPTKE